MNNIKEWLKNPNNWTIVASLVAIIALLVSIVALVYTARQLCIARYELEVSKSALQISQSALEVARTDLEAKTRPYLSVESIELEDSGGKWIPIVIGLINRGDLPATSVQLDSMAMGGEQLVWASDFDEDYPAIKYTTEEGITITAGGIVIAPQRHDFPNDIIFFPNKYSMIEVPAHATTWRTTIVEGVVMDIGLNYARGENQYWYIATAILSNGEWKVVLERGN